MGKFILEIGLVAGTERLCNTCALLNREKEVCGALVSDPLEIRIEIENGKFNYIRPNECPLTSVETWPSEASWKPTEFTLA